MKKNFIAFLVIAILAIASILFLQTGGFPKFQENQDVSTLTYMLNGVSSSTPQIETEDYVVSPGETWWSISKKFNTSVLELTKLNGRSIFSMLWANETIRVPKSATEEVEAQVESEVEYDVYHVQPGDTYWGISRKYGITVQELLEMNNLEEGTMLYADTDLNVPFLKAETAPEETAQGEVAQGETAQDDIEVKDNQIEETTTTTNSNTKYSTQNIENTVKKYEEIYPGIDIGCGVYLLDGTTVYEHNSQQLISGCCTIKAPYTMFVLDECERCGIDIYSQKLKYELVHKNGGSGQIQYDPIGTEYTIDRLLYLLDYCSDNTAYNILCSRFTVHDFQSFLDTFGGQRLWGNQYGKCTVNNRRNEWLKINQYINENHKYSSELKRYLTGTLYCYIVQGMTNPHTYQHKSGWCYGNYNGAGDCAIIDGQYLVVILTQDYQTLNAHENVVQGIARQVEATMS